MTVHYRAHCSRFAGSVQGGYTFIMINNLATAASGVITKKKLDSKGLGTWGLMFYNTVCNKSVGRL